MTSSPRKTVRCHYHYDPLDRLISHALPNTPERQRFYCKSRLATEIQGAMRYSIIQQGDQLLAQQRSEGGAPDTTLLATDQQRSVLQALKADHSPSPLAYSPYGHRAIETGLLCVLGFNGERPDPVTGCYLLGNGYRAFNPVLMRFNSPDNLSPFNKGGLNSYAYCMGNPITNSDPTGHFSLKLIELLEHYKPSLKIPRPFSKITPNSEVAGFHGSSNVHITSLEKGVRNAKIAAYGPGFYATPDIADAASYARGRAFGENMPYWADKYSYDDIYPYANTSLSPAVSNVSYHLMPSTPEIFSVHVKNYSAKRPSIDFTFVPKSDVINKRTGRQLVFPKATHSDIKAKHLTSLIHAPEPWTDNLKIRNS